MVPSEMTNADFPHTQIYIYNIYIYIYIYRVYVYIYIYTHKSMCVYYIVSTEVLISVLIIPYLVCFYLTFGYGKSPVGMGKLSSIFYKWV